MNKIKNWLKEREEAIGMSFTVLAMIMVICGIVVGAGKTLEGLKVFYWTKTNTINPSAITYEMHGEKYSDPIDTEIYINPYNPVEYIYADEAFEYFANGLMILGATYFLFLAFSSCEKDDELSKKLKQK